MPPKRAKVMGDAIRAEVSGTKSKKRSTSQVADPFHLRGEFLERYRVLSEKSVESTIYLHNETLHRMGIFDNVRALFATVGMGTFIDIRTPAYRALTLEFLSSLEVSVTRGPHCNPGRIAFRLGGQHRELNLTEFSAIFGLPPALRMKYRDGSFVDLKNTWRRLTGEASYIPQRAKATKICNPVFRYIQRVLSTGIFARSDSMGVVRSAETFILTGMLDKIQVDVGALLADHFLDTATNTRSQSIHIGGLITPIALHFGFNPTAHGQQAIPPRDLDLALLKTYKMIRWRIGSPIWWIYPNKMMVVLPNPSTNVNDPANLLYGGKESDNDEGEEEEEVEEGGDAPMHQPPLHQPDYQTLWQRMEQLQVTVEEQSGYITALRNTVADQQRRLDANDSTYRQWDEWRSTHFPPP